MFGNVDSKVPTVVVEEENGTKVTDNKENFNETRPDLEKLLTEQVDEEVLTPLTKINLKWRRKSAGLCISHSDMSGLVTTTKAKSDDTSVVTLRRTTSTPMAQTSLTSINKPTNLDSLCGSSYQASSIEHASDHSSDTHSPLAQPIVSPSPVVPSVKHVPIHTTQRIKRYRLPVSQTPLRQLMSKSIQKNLHQNGIYFRAQRKIPFYAMNSSDSSSGSNNSSRQVSPTDSSCVPLDLRTTPVLRRTQSDITPERRALLLPRKFNYDGQLLIHEQISPKTPDQLSTDDSGAIGYATNDTYSSKNSCFIFYFSSEELVNSVHDNATNERSQTDLSRPEHTAFLSCNNQENTKPSSLSLTPDITKSFNATEVWYTPKAFEPRKPFLEAMLRKAHADDLDERHSDGEEHGKHQKIEHEGSSGLKFWRLFSSVIRFAGVSGQNNNHSDKDEVDVEIKQSPPKKNSLVKRAATFAGWIRGKSPEKGFKRPRQGSQSSNASGTSVGESAQSSVSPPLPSAKKYKTIQGRKPIQRLRKE